MHCVLSAKANPDFKFVFAETHLKAKEECRSTRVKQISVLLDFYAPFFTNIPVFIAGDFNEDPDEEPIADLMNS